MDIDDVIIRVVSEIQSSKRANFRVPEHAMIVGDCLVEKIKTELSKIGVNVGFFEIKNYLHKMHERELLFESRTIRDDGFIVCDKEHIANHKIIESSL